jgi:regulator of protease activity HflC (stomatin/prohibitin superfamily)
LSRINTHAEAAGSVGGQMAGSLAEAEKKAVRRGGSLRKIVPALSLLVAAFLLLYFYPYLFVTIHAGERGVLWSRWTGTDLTSVYLEGTQFVWPWNKLVVYDVRYKTVPQSLTLLSNDGLPIKVSMMIRYRPADRLLARLYDEVGPDFAKVIVLPEVATALRRIVAEHSVEELYESKFGDIRDEMLEEAQREAGKRYVILDDVMFTDIELPASVSEAIQHKIQQQQSFEEMKYVNQTAELEAQRKLIEAKGIEEQQQHINNTLTDRLLQYKSIEAAKALAESPNAKIVVMGGGHNGTPIILNPGDSAPSPKK